MPDYEGEDGEITGYTVAVDDEATSEIVGEEVGSMMGGFASEQEARDFIDNELPAPTLYGIEYYLTPDETRRLFEAVEFIAEFFENGTPVHPETLYRETDPTVLYSHYDTIGFEIIALRDAIDKR